MSYAGALTVLVAAAVTFVGSLSLAVGLRLAPNKEPRHPERLVHASAAPQPAPVAPPAQEPIHAPAAAAPEPNKHPLLTGVLEHIRGHHDPAPKQPAPAQAPNDGPPSP